MLKARFDNYWLEPIIVDSKRVRFPGAACFLLLQVVLDAAELLVVIVRVDFILNIHCGEVMTRAFANIDLANVGGLRASDVSTEQ